MDDAEHHLQGGNMAPVVRAGETVRRVTGPWTPAVHRLLAALHEAGLEGIPRALGIDGEGREVRGALRWLLMAAAGREVALGHLEGEVAALA